MLALQETPMTEKVSWTDKYVYYKLKNFRQKVNFSINTGKFTIKTANSAEDVVKALKLRHDVFIEEKLNKSNLLNVDFDKFDLMADHILVIDNNSEAVVATYRVICNLFSSKYYSESEFKIKDFLNTDEVKIEIGRATIAKSHRNGASLSLVWKGIGKYANLCNAKYIFGCASIPTTSALHAFLVYHALNESHCNDWDIQPKKFQPIKIRPLFKNYISNEEIQKYIPPLLSSYLKAGAKVASLPSIDHKMQCSDFLTVLNIEEMNEKYKRKYLENH